MATDIGKNEQESPEPFGHISGPCKAKVCADSLDHLDGDQWDLKNFDPENDYQRHLYALFLKIAGKTRSEIFVALEPLCTDILGPPTTKSKYIDTVIHSEIVGFTYPNGMLHRLPPQEINRPGYEQE